MIRQCKYSLLNYIIFIITYYIIFIKLNIIYCDDFHFIEFSSKNYIGGRFAFNLNGDMIIEYSYNKYRLFYGLKQNGKSYFKDNNHNETTMKEIEISEGLYNRKYAKNIFILLNDKTEYLFSTGYNSITEIHNLETNEYKIKDTNDYLSNTIYSELFSILKLNNINEYIIIYLEKLEKNCIIQKLSFSDFSLNSLQIIKTQTISIGKDHRSVCGFIMNENIIVFYLDKNYANYYYYINIYDYNLIRIIKKIEIGKAYLLESYGKFFKGLHVNNNLMAFSYLNDQYYLEFKIGSLNTDYSFSSKFKEMIDEFFSFALLNDFIKLNDKRLVYVGVKYNDDSKFSIILFDLYDNYNYMKIRKYNNLNLNNKYKIEFDLELNIYNNYIVFTSTVYDNPNDYNKYSIFMIFGYINGTDEYINMNEYFMDDYINSNKNIIDKLIENKEIENNIFGYIILQQIKLISIPKELLFYDINNILLSNNSILNKEYKLIQNNNIIKNNEYYYLDYQNIISEPDYDTFNYKASDIINLPHSNSFVDQRDYYNPNKYCGRTNTLKFKLCHDYCNTCSKYGISNNNQQCLSCLPLYQYNYINEFSSNCIPEGYYYDKEENKLIQCNINNSKFFINETNNKTICFKNNIECPNEYPYFYNSNKQCTNFQIFSTLPTTLINKISTQPTTIKNKISPITTSTLSTTLINKISTTLITSTQPTTTKNKISTTLIPSIQLTTLINKISTIIISSTQPTTIKNKISTTLISSTQPTTIKDKISTILISSILPTSIKNKISSTLIYEIKGSIFSTIQTTILNIIPTTKISSSYISKLTTIINYTSKTTINNFTDLFTTEINSIFSTDIQDEKELHSYLNITKEDLLGNIDIIMENVKIGEDYQILGEGFELVIKPTNSSFLENSTHINFEKCEDILRREKNISLSRIITILQLEIYNTKEQSLVNQVEYAAYNDNKEILDLSVCKDTDIEIIHAISNDSFNLSDYNSFKNSGIDIFNIDDSFFKDICHPYSNSKNDLVLEDRIKYIYQNYSICDQGCSYNKIDFENKVISCICKVKANLSTEETSLNIKKFSEIKIESNFGLIKCYQLVFSFVGKLKNIGFFIFLILILIHIPLIIYYLSKGIQPIKSFLHNEMTKYGYALKKKVLKIKIKRLINQQKR